MVHIIKPRAIYEFCESHPEYKQALEAWLTLVESCNWEKPSDIVAEFGPKAIDLLGKKDTKPATKSSNRVVFDIRGNNIRIIAKYQFHPKLKASRLYIKWIGTHPEYDELCDSRQQFDIEMFK
jgi:mRNA interferase HigB